MAALAARIGAMAEAMALTNCPNVRKLDCFSGFTILANRGLRDTCMIVFPIPIKEKATNMLILS